MNKILVLLDKVVAEEETCGSCNWHSTDSRTHSRRLRLQFQSFSHMNSISGDGDRCGVLESQELAHVLTKCTGDRFRSCRGVCECL